MELLFVLHWALAMTPALAAHLRLMAILPVRTHSTREGMESNRGRLAFREDELESVLTRMKEMRASGKTLKEVGVEFGIAAATVLRYLK
jgi:hypothetical protein